LGQKLKHPQKVMERQEWSKKQGQVREKNKDKVEQSFEQLVITRRGKGESLAGTRKHVNEGVTLCDAMVNGSTESG
ncbi:Hypothetical predicted protein, partial [Olea europaea subsp. europaea]